MFEYFEYFELCLNMSEKSSLLKPFLPLFYFFSLIRELLIYRDIITTEKHIFQIVRKLSKWKDSEHYVRIYHKEAWN